jgi:energy-coupling factor transporter ATP-binding protein EcfA2
MKIRAIRLHEVRRFSSGVALEGLSGGLDVLAGPNEAGKSTLLAALRAVFTEKYSGSSGKTVGKLRSTEGGAPLVEVDFELGGSLFRLRKRFLQSAMAELRDLGGASHWRNADVQERLDGLLAQAGHSAGQALLWVDQGGFALPDAGQSLQAMIEAEAQSVADGGQVRRMRARIDAELKPFLTAKNRQPTGVYLAAQKDATAAALLAETARTRRDLVEDRLQKLQAATNDLAELTAGPADALRRQAVVDARVADAQARRDRDLADQAHAKAALAQQVSLRASDALKAFVARVEDLDRVGVSRNETAAKIATLAQRIEDAQAALVSMTVSTATAAAEVARLDVMIASHHVTARREALVALRDRATRAAAAAAELAIFDRVDAADLVTDALVTTARTATSDVERIGLRLKDRAPELAITYEPGAEGRIVSDGQPVTADGSWPVRGRVTLVIAGVGCITITPPLGEDDANLEAQLIKAQLSLDRALAAMGVATLAAAEVRLIAQRVRRSDRTTVAAQLAILAPKGLAALAGEVAALEQDLERSAAAVENNTSPAVLALPAAQHHRAEAAVRHATALRAEEAARLEVQGLSERQAGLAATLRVNDARYTELSGSLRDAAWRSSQQAALVAEAESALVAHTAFAQDLAVLRAMRPDDARLRELSLALRTAEQAETDVGRRATALRETVVRLEGELTRDQDEDIEAEADRLSGAAIAAAAVAAHMTREVEALQRLSDLFAAADAANSGTLYRPVLERLAPFLAQVFPGAAIEFGAGYVPTQLTRDLTVHELDRLSLGTQEQVAVLVRLAFARLLADRGQPVPLILDDALVYADDQRIEQMFGVLRSASLQHQVIVLTCRERTFDTLGGTKLKLAPWMPN